MYLFPPEPRAAGRRRQGVSERRTQWDGSYRTSMLTERSGICVTRAVSSTTSGATSVSASTLGKAIAARSLHVRHAPRHEPAPHRLRLRQRALPSQQGLRRQALTPLMQIWPERSGILTQRFFYPHAPRSGAPGRRRWTEDWGPHRARPGFRPFGTRWSAPRSSSDFFDGPVEMTRSMRGGSLAGEVAKPVEGQSMSTRATIWASPMRFA